MFSVGLVKGKFKYLLFKLTQHVRDEQLMKTIENYLNCGYCYLRKEENLIDFKVTKFSAVVEIIIPFFLNNHILGEKALDFKDWCTVAEIVKKNEDSTEDGAIEIQNIKAGMNRGRHKLSDSV